jgi:hypothetical protein
MVRIYLMPSKFILSVTSLNMARWKSHNAILTQPFFFFLLAEVAEMSGACAELERLQADDNELILDTESVDSWRNILPPAVECNSVPGNNKFWKDLSYTL